MQEFIDFQHQQLPTTRARLTIWVGFAGIIALLIWASLAKIDQVTRAQAQVIASDHTQIVQTAEQGVVTQFHVKEGDQVKAGQLLVTLEKARAEAAVGDLSAKVAALKIALIRLQAEVYGKPLVFDDELSQYSEYINNQRDLYVRRKAAIDTEVASLGRLLSLVREELSMNQNLELTGDVSYSEILKLKRNVADIAAQIDNKRNKYFQDAQAEMTKVQEELNTRTEELRDRNQLLSYTELNAPADGIVKNMKVTTEGAVVRPGDVILEILPTSSDLIVEAKIKTEDIAFIEKGQPSSVKLDAYDYSIFGTMEGKVSYISPDTLTEDTPQGPKPYYRVKVIIEGQQYKGSDDKEIHVRPGMTATVEIKAAERTVLNYLTKPIAKTLSQSLGER